MASFFHEEFTSQGFEMSIQVYGIKTCLALKALIDHFIYLFYLKYAAGKISSQMHKDLFFWLAGMD